MTYVARLDKYAGVVHELRRLAFALAIALPSCGPRPRPRWACEAAPRLYPSQHGPIPVSPWLLARFDCELLEDLNRDG